MTDTTDFTYTDDALWVRLYPNTPEAEQVWRENQEDGVFGCLTMFKKQTIAQLRKAGCTVKKSKKIKNGELNKLLSELGI